MPLLAAVSMVGMLVGMGTHIPMLGGFIMRSLSPVLADTYRRSRALGQRDAEAHLRRDPRPPVLLLRSFADDERLIEVRVRVSTQRSGFENVLIRAERFEEVLARQLWSIGPVIAVGRPGEPLPLLGAARTYLPVDEWEPKVSSLMDQAALIIVVLGESAGLVWKIDRLCDSAHLGKTVIAIPPLIGVVKPRWVTLDTRLRRHHHSAPRMPPAPGRYALCVWRLDSDEPALADRAILERVVLRSRAPDSDIRRRPTDGHMTVLRANRISGRRLRDQAVASRWDVTAEDLAVPDAVNRDTRRRFRIPPAGLDRRRRLPAAPPANEKWLSTRVPTNLLIADMLKRLRALWRELKASLVGADATREPACAPSRAAFGPSPACERRRVFRGVTTL